MRYSVVLTATVVLACLSPCAAQPETASHGSSAAAAPTASQLIAKLNEFNAFQKNAYDRTASLDRSDLTSAASVRAEAAARRARALAALEISTGVSAYPASKQSLGRETMLADVSPTDGTDFVRQFYAAEIAEYETTIAVLQSYLAAPDNQEVRRFAMVELTDLQIELNDIKSALAEK